MGIFKDIVQSGIDFVREEVVPLRQELVKAGVLTPDKSAYEPKASLADPMAYGSYGMGYKEKYSFLDYTRCRYVTYADPVVAAVLQTRLNQVAAFSIPQTDKYKVGFKIIMRDKEGKPSKGDKGKIRELEQFLINCGVPEDFEDTPERKKRDNFETFLRKITRDSLTFDQINFEVTPRNNGMPYGFQAVDGSTVRLIADVKELREAYQSEQTAFLKDNVIEFGGGKKFKEFKPKHPRYCQVVNGIIRHIFDEWEMAFGIRNPRTDLLAYGYGFSEIEMLMTTITAHINTEAYNRRFFSQGSTIKGVLSFEGSVPPDQLEAFRRQWYNQTTGVANAWRTPIMALGKENKLNWVSLHSTNREMEYGKWMEYLIKTICGVFQMDPIEIGFDISRQGAGQGGSTGGLGNGNQMERVIYSQDKGLRPLLRHIQTLINDYLVYRIDPNFEFEFVGLNATSEKDELDQNEKKTKTYQTVNELRAHQDLPPIKSLDEIESPADLILDASWITAWSQAKQSAQMQEQQGMGGGEGGMPEPEGEPEPEPNYEAMDTDQLQEELKKLEGPQGQQAQGQPSQGQPQGKPGAMQAKGSLKQTKPAGKKPPPEGLKKSMELIL